MNTTLKINESVGEENQFEEEDTLKDNYLTFHIANEVYALEIRDVTEIIGIQKITDVPDVPHYIKGVINLRGKVIPIMDVRLRFGMEPKEYDERTCVIVVNIQGKDVGLVVDTVSEVTSIPEEDVEPSPAGHQNSANQYIKGMGKIGEEIRIIIDGHNLLYGENFDNLSTQNETEEN